MGYLQNQLRAQAAILDDPEGAVADAPTDAIAKAANATGLVSEAAPAPAEPEPPSNPTPPRELYYRAADGNFVPVTP